MPKPVVNINLQEINPPDKPGVYLMKGLRGKLLYVGKAKNLRKRLQSYFQKKTSHTTKVEALVKQVKSVDYILAPSELDAYILENTLIKEQQPPYNIQLRDDKTYPYIKLSTDKYPRLDFVRKILNDNAKYFGPFSAASEVRKALKLMSSYYKLRTCPGEKPGRPGNSPCLDYYMHRCLAPCVYDVDVEYRQYVQEVTLLLEGKNSLLQKKLQKEMAECVASKDYETAAVCRDKLKALAIIQRKQKVVFQDNINCDTVGIVYELGIVIVVVLSIREGLLNNIRNFHFSEDRFVFSDIIEKVMGQLYNKTTYIPKEIYIQENSPNIALMESWLQNISDRAIKIRVPHRGQKAVLIDMALENAQEYSQGINSSKNRDNTTLQDLQKVLNLDQVPYRIEAYDISNISGKQMVASQVVFQNGQPDKAEYRCYNIKTLPDTPNDTGAIFEVLDRRFKRMVKNPSEKRPQLMVIDGGRGQLSAALRARTLSGLTEPPIISLAKQDEEIFLPQQQHPIQLSLKSPSLLLLRHIRDEAHRFAITFHRRKRKKALLG